MKTRALTYYLNHHIRVVTDMPHVPGCLAESISEWKLSSKSSPMVDLALSALALLVYSRIQQQPEAATEAARNYYQILRMMQDHVKNLPSIEDFDTLLLTILLMGRYEGASHKPEDFEMPEQFKQLRNWSHHDGAMAVLKIWNDKVDHGTATYIIKQARRGLIRSAFLRSLPLPAWILDGTRFGEEGLELHYDRLEVGLVNLRNATACLEGESDSEASKIEDLNKQAQELDSALQDWVANIPGKYSYQSHTLPHSDSNNDRSWLSPHFYSLTIYSFTKPGHAAAWLQYFSTRMLIASTRLRILQSHHVKPAYSDDVYTQQKLTTLATLNTAADNLSSTIPFPIGRFKLENPKTLDDSKNKQPVLITINEKDAVEPYLANIVIWPLSIAAGLKGLERTHQLWFRTELAGLGRLVGDGIIESAEMENWVSF